MREESRVLVIMFKPLYYILTPLVSQNIPFRVLNEFELGFQIFASERILNNNVILVT